MCSITALAHIRAAVLFFLDISGSCGYSIAQQAALFHSIKSLFMNKPLIIVCNKTVLQPLDGISEEDKKLVAEMKNEAMKTLVGQGGEATSDEMVLLTMSTLTEEGLLLSKMQPCKVFSFSFHLKGIDRILKCWEDVTATKGIEFEDYFLKCELLMGILEKGFE